MKYVSNIDTICILVDIDNYTKNSVDILELLKNEKEKALLEVTSNANSKHMVTINEMAFQLFPNGSRGSAYILRNNGYEVKISQYRPNLKAFYPIQVRISSEYLWSIGLADSWSIIYNWLTETFGNVKDNKISRVDLCTHVSNIDFLSNYDFVYKGNFKKRGYFVTNKEINGLTFGSRKSANIYCRVYNKTLEIQETKQKEWFKQIWLDNEMDINNVWNLEFEIKSGFLREVNVNTVSDLINCTANIWQYCTKEWLQKIDRTNTRVERCEINSDWLEIQKTYDTFRSKAFISREKQILLDANALLPNMVGSITSYSARKGFPDIKEAFQNIFGDTIKYLQKKNTDFENTVLNKMTILADKEVKNNE